MNLREAMFINKSLSFLEQVVVSVCDRKRDHIPYRQSKLTNLLKNSIGGNCKTVMIANCWPEQSHIEETISTLKFATRMMRVSNDPIINEQQDPALLIKKYQKEIKELKQELMMHDTLASRGRVQYDQYTPEQQYEVQKQAEAFLEGPDDIDQIESMRHAFELFAQMRNIYQKTEQSGFGPGQTPEGQQDSSTPTNKELERRKTMGMDDRVGDIDETEEFGIGRAPK